MLKSVASQQGLQMITQIPTTATEEHSEPYQQNTSSVNLFHLQADYQEQLNRAASSRNLRRVRKTPGELIKQGLLRSRQSRRQSSLKSITAQNIKIFLRLQGQKSAYELSALHKHLSCSILPLPRSNSLRRDDAAGKEQEKSTGRDLLRCCSAAETLKTQCASLKQLISHNSRNSTPRQEGESLQFAASRAMSKVSLFTDRHDKENRGGNTLASNRHLSKQAEEAIILKKIGMKVASGRGSLTTSSHQLMPVSLGSKQLAAKPLPVKQSRCALMERQQNFPL